MSRFFVTIDASAVYTTTAPTLQALVDGVVISSQTVTTHTGSGDDTLSFSLDFPDIGYPASLAFKFSAGEGGGSVTIDSVAIDGQVVGAGDLSSTLLAFGASSAVTVANVDYMFGMVEPSLADFGAITKQGTGANETLVGTAGHDSIDGAAGNDLIISQNGDDSITGGSGNDTIVSGSGNNLIFGDAGNDIISVGSGNNLIYGGSGNDTIVTGNGNNVVNTGTGDNKVATGSGGDVIHADTGTNMISAGGGDDTVDVVAGGAAHNMVDGGSGNDTITGGDGGDTMTGGVGDDTVTGGTGDDILYGDAGDDTIAGGDGNDVIIGGTGANTIDGGAGDDLIYATSIDTTVATAIVKGHPEIVYNAATDSFYEYVSGGTDYATAAAAAAALTQSGVAGHLVNITSASEEAFVKALVGAGNSAWLGASDSGVEGTWIWTGGPEASTQFWDGDLTGNATNGLYANWAAGEPVNSSGNEDYAVLNGTTGTWSAAVTGASYGYVIEWDGLSFSSDTSTNIVTGGDGNDVIYGGGGDDILGGGNDDDTIFAGGGDDTITGDAGNDVIDGGAGNDIIDGGLGNDIIIASTGNDAIDGGGGTDTIDYTKVTNGVTVDLSAGTAANNGYGGTNTITGVENIAGSNFGDSVTGDGGPNLIKGLAGDDVLTGGTGDDILRGGGGNDTLDGGTGNNTIDGGAGTADTITYATAAAGVTVNLTTGTATNGGGGTDTLMAIESVTGSTHDDTIAGDNGNNTLDGNGGTDTLTYADATAGIAISLDVATAQNTGGAGIDTVSGFTNLIGSVYDDTLTGNGSDNVITGDNGNDVITGGAGSDTIDGGAGNDIIYAGGGVSVIEDENFSGGVGGYSFTGTSYTTDYSPESSNDYDGNNSLHVRLGNGSSGTHTNLSGIYELSFNLAQAVVNAQLSFSYEIISTNLDNATETPSLFAKIDGVTVFTATVTPNGGTVDSGWLLTGTIDIGGLAAGSHTLDLQGSLTSENSSNEHADFYFDTVNLSTYGDANASDVNIVTGGAGNDILYGSASTHDFLSYADATSAVTIDLSDTSAQATGGSGTDTISGFENLTGSSYNDTLSGDGAANAISGGDGNDTLYGGAGSDTLDGGDGNDIMYASVAGETPIDTTFPSSSNYQGFTFSGAGTYFSHDLNSSDYGSDYSIHTQLGRLSGGSGSTTYTNMYGTYDLAFNLTNDSSDVTLSFYYNITSTSLDSGENSTLNALVDGVNIFTDTLNGNGGSTSTGWTLATIDLGSMTAGAHTLDLQGYLNRSNRGEHGDFYFDNVNITASGGGDNNSSNVLDGGAGNDVLYGSAGTDTLMGGADNDALHSGSVASITAAQIASDYGLQYNSTTGNFYLFVNSAQEWVGANADAESRYLYGVAGHLAVVTSAAENSYVAGIASGNIWLGGTDEDAHSSEGHWVWVGGSASENGVEFWQGVSGSGSAQNGFWNNWNSGEPNEYGVGEDYLEMYTSSGVWNDNGAPNQTLYDNYVVEWEGADVMAVVAANPTTLNGGAGADDLYGSAGQDIFAFDDNADKFTNPDIINDFSESQGDTIDISDVLSGLGVNSGNLSQYVDVSSGSGVRIDTSGSGSFGGAGHTIATFTGTTVISDEATMLAAGHLII